MYVGIAFGSVWVHFGITLGSLCGQFMIINFGFILDSFWDHFGLILCQFVVISASIWEDFRGFPHDVPVHPLM